MAAIANYHKLGGLKQRKCIVLQFWTPEVLKSRPHWAAFLLEASGEDLFSCFFQCLETAYISWVMALLSPSKLEMQHLQNSHSDCGTPAFFLQGPL